MSTPRLPWDDVPEAVASPTALSDTASATRTCEADAASPVHVCVHGAARVRLAAVRRHVIARGIAGVRVLAPTHAQAHDVVRLALADERASMGVERAGWVGFSVRLATPALVARGLVPVSGLGFEALVARAVARARAERVLTCLADASRHPGFVLSLARTLADLRLAGIPAEQLGGASDKARDLAWLLRALEEGMQHLGHADRAQVLALATQAAQEAPAGDLELPLAMVDPPLGSRRDVDLARALLARSSDALVTGPVGDPSLPRLLDGLGAVADAVRVDDHAVSPEALRRVQTGIFSTDSGADEGRGAPQRRPRGAAQRAAPTVGDAMSQSGGDASTESLGAALGRVGDVSVPRAGNDTSVECLSAPGEGRECIEVARTLLAHAEHGTPFDRMAVVMRAPDLYASHLETAFRRAEIPAWYGRGTRRPDPAGRAFVALLACAAEDLSARRFAEYLSLGQVPAQPPTSSRSKAGAHQQVPVRVAADEAEALGLSADEGLPILALASPATISDDAPADASESRRAPWRWEAILNDARVIGGAHRWTTHLEGYRRELHLRARAERAEDRDSARSRSLRKRAIWTRQLIRFAHDVVVRPEPSPAVGGGRTRARAETLADWPRVDDWGRWLVRLEQLAPRVLRQPERVLATLAELRPLSGVAQVSLAEVHEVLRDRLTHLPVQPPPHRYGRVFVGTPDQVRARMFDVVCVPGLSERVFPQRSRQDPLLLDQERAVLSPHLATDEDRVAVERLQLRLAAGAATRVLVTSYASLETAQARPRVPSFYALDVQRAVTGMVPGYESLIRDAQRRSGARLAWPAPDDPLAAIDAAEHDLSTLQQYLRGPDGDIVGRARYLFELNRSLRRALLARHQRLSRAWTEHDGLVAAQDALAAHRLTARTYSASALQRYAACPYQFYLSTILRLEPREEATPLATLDPLTRGSMVHEMLAEIMRTYIDRAWLPLNADRLAEAQAVADACVTRIAAAQAARLLPPIVRVWDDAIAGVRRDIHEWVRRLADDQDGWVPAHVEIGVGFSGGFGRDDASRREEAVLPDGTRLHGIVDLLERRGADEWRITDYKTGRYHLGDRVIVNGGRTLQPILYAMAVEAVLGGRVTASRLYYCTDDGDYTEHPWAVAGALGETTRQTGLDVLKVIDRAIESGQLPAAPDDRACTWCDFQAVCGPGAQDVPGRKDGRALAELRELRGWR